DVARCCLLWPISGPVFPAVHARGTIFLPKLASSSAIANPETQSGQARRCGRSRSQGKGEEGASRKTQSFHGRRPFGNDRWCFRRRHGEHKASRRHSRRECERGGCHERRKILAWQSPANFGEDHRSEERRVGKEGRDQMEQRNQTRRERT